jgi:hypothetical protein
MEKIIVDIDNTLWNLAPVLYSRLREKSPDLPPTTKWREWDFKGWPVTPKAIYPVLNRIHMEQDTFSPFPDAAEFLRSLKEMEFSIIIASHRLQDAFGPTERWLRQNDLVYDEIYLSRDKTVLFHDSWGVVDDSPETLNRARDAGIIRAGLRNPWNEGQDHPLFDDLTAITGYLRQQKHLADNNGPTRRKT